MNSNAMVVINQFNNYRTEQKCLICSDPVPIWRIDLGLCFKHSKYFYRRNWWIQNRLAGMPLTVEQFVGIYSPNNNPWTPERAREANRLRARREYKLNPQRARDRSRKWYRENREKAIASARDYRQKNPEYGREANRIRSRRNRQAPGVCTQDLWMQRVVFYGWKCFYCKKPLSNKTLTIDHRIPLARGGSHWPANLVPCCKPCNSRKGDKIK